MAVLDSLKDTINKGVTAVSVKSESLVESSRVKSAMGSSQKKLDAELSALGMKFYQAWKAGETEGALFADDLARARAIEEEMDGLRARLEQIKAEEDKILGSAAKPAAQGGVFCTNCGKRLLPGSRFCDECGTPVG
ncbi:MAG: zinc ribbon domain-containing protein [Oscillospiraceae bacterium]|nr:zinc ribbon domain-containing protein [Oscillospiraceae bacterium]